MKIFNDKKNLMRKVFLLLPLFFLGTTSFSQKLINVTKEVPIKTENSSLLKKIFINKIPNTGKTSTSKMRKVTSEKVDSIALKYGDDIVKAIGTGSQATMLPLSMFYMDPYSGCSLTKVNIGLAYAATNVKIHIRTAINGSDLFTQNVGNLSAGWHSIILTTPYKISTSSLVIGYEATTAASASTDETYILGITDNTTFLGNARYLEMNGKYYTQSHGCWAIQGIVQGDNLPQNEVALYALTTKLVKSNSPFTVKGAFWNLGAKPVESYEIGYSINGVNGSQTVKCDSVKPYDLGNFELNIQAANIPHQDSALINLEVKKVNGTDDEYSDDNSGSTYLTSTDNSYPHKVVVEEGTGAWCGWCVRGIVGMENLRKKYPDTFIPIAIHYSKDQVNNKDGLEIDRTAAYSYIEYLNKYISSFPTCIVDRKYSSDPYYGLEDMYNEEQSEPCLFDYKYKSLNYNSSTGLVSATVTAKFAFGYKDANYATAFVVVEDSLTTKNAQANYYADNAYGEMGGFENLPASITNQNYNDVALGIYSNWQGDLSFPTTIVAGTSYDYSYSFTLPATKNINNVRIVSLLLNATTGETVNAASTPLVENSTGINTLTNKDGIDVTVKRNSDNTITVASPNVIKTNISLYTINGELVCSASMSGTQMTLPVPSKGGIYFVKAADKTIKIVL